MKPLLTSLGLSELQAATYLYLFNNQHSAPPVIAKQLGMTRTNAYKVLDSLEELSLVNKSEIKKKLVYSAADPTALASIVAEKRNDLLALEHYTQTAIQELRKLKKPDKQILNVATKQGKAAMVSAYESQIQAEQPIYFVRTRADIPFMGFETMDRIRKLVSGGKTKRYGITPDSVESPINPKIDKKTNLSRTWVASEAYISPVEWTVSGDKLLIQVFEGDGKVIEIDDQVVAESFRELWKIMDANLKANPAYEIFPRSAKRQL